MNDYVYLAMYMVSIFHLYNFLIETRDYLKFVYNDALLMKRSMKIDFLLIGFFIQHNNVMYNCQKLFYISTCLGTQYNNEDL